MNVYDTSKMKNLLRNAGYESTEEITEADLVILNTCHIREKASEKVYSELGKLKLLKDARKKQDLDMLIVVAGCVAQAEGEVIFQRANYVDAVVGPQSLQTLPSMLEKITNDNSKEINLKFEADQKFDFLEEEKSTQGVSSFLTIQEGCDKFCKFCCVPYTRGAEYSRPVHEIYREAMQLAGSGAKEITLLGQNVSAYKAMATTNQEFELGGLIRLIADIPQVERIRYTTSHPNDMQDKLIEAHRDVKKLMPFLHLPVQSGSNKLLKDMNRKHTREEYFRLIDKFRKARPDIAFSSDFIVGYPGETDQDFADTLDLIRTVNFSQCYSFKYSIRPGTPAATMEDQIPESVKDARIAEIQKVIFEQQEAFNKSFVGKKVKVLLDKDGKRAGQAGGKSEHMQSVYIDNASELKGSIVEVLVTQATTNSLTGIKV
jgi:tRNA-2-methylthio-N6-dimethylallyladenosine synthase